MDQQEKLIAISGTRITFEEIDRRFNSNLLVNIGLRFQDLACNQVRLVLSNGCYQHDNTEVNYDLGYPRIMSYTRWTDQSDDLTVSGVNSRFKLSEFENIETQLKSILPSEYNIETEFVFNIDDYYTDEVASFFVRIGTDENLAILRVKYPIYPNDHGSLDIIMSPNDQSLGKKIEFFEKVIPSLISKRLLPNTTSARFQIKFNDDFDESEVLSKFELITASFEKYKQFFNKDLLSLRNIQTSDGFYRAIVYFLGPNCGLLFLQNTDLYSLDAVNSHEKILNSWKEDLDREQLVKATGFSTDSMSNYIHCFIKFDEKGIPVLFIDRGNPIPDWFRSGGFTREQVGLYLSQKYGVKNDFRILEPDVSKRMALSGALGERIKGDSELLHREYGTKYRDKYLALAEKFRIQERNPFSAGWDEFQALELLIEKLRDSKRK